MCIDHKYYTLQTWGIVSMIRPVIYRHCQRSKPGLGLGLAIKNGRRQVNKKFHKLDSVYRDCIKRTRDKTS